MCCDVDPLAVRQLRFQLLGEDSGSSETSDQLLTTLGAMISTTLVANNGVGDVAVTSGKTNVDDGETDGTVAPRGLV